LCVDGERCQLQYYGPLLGCHRQSVLPEYSSCAPRQWRRTQLDRVPCVKWARSGVHLPLNHSPLQYLL